MLADTELMHRIRLKLAEDPLLATTVIRIETEDGIVRLRGVVHTSVQQARAIEIARVAGRARRIDSQLIRHGRSGVADGPLAHTQLQL